MHCGKSSAVMDFPESGNRKVHWARATSLVVRLVFCTQNVRAGKAEPEGCGAQSRNRPASLKPAPASQRAASWGGTSAGDPGLPGRRPAAAWLARWFVLLLLLLLLPEGLAAGEEVVPQNPDKVKAAYLLNFTRYVTWPTNAFANAKSPWRIGVLGSADPLADALDKILQGRTEQGRGFEICRAATVDKLPPCQIVFIAHKDADRRRAALAAFKDKPVLTVGDEAYFLQDGGIIRFQTTDRVQMSINLDQARAVSLNIQAKMLEVSYAVLENGALRKLK
jgi:hypothetical protein